MKPELESSKPLGKGMISAAWVLLLVMLTWFFGGGLESDHRPNHDPQSQTHENYREVILKRSRNGHYVAQGKINGQDVVFLLDTGATSVAIPENIARRLGLKAGPVVRVNTANGRVDNYATRLRNVQLGDITLNNISAVISPQMKDQEILLGMSFLKHVEFSQRGDQLILHQY